MKVELALIEDAFVFTFISLAHMQWLIVISYFLNETFFFFVWVKSNMHVLVIDSRPPRSTVNISIFLFSNKFAYLYLRYLIHIVLVRDQFVFHNLTKIKISPQPTLLMEYFK